jgi:hypothetical protein
VTAFISLAIHRSQISIDTIREQLIVLENLICKATMADSANSKVASAPTDQKNDDCKCLLMPIEILQHGY